MAGALAIGLLAEIMSEIAFAATRCGVTETGPWGQAVVAADDVDGRERDSGAPVLHILWIAGIGVGPNRNRRLSQSEAGIGEEDLPDLVEPFQRVVPTVGWTRS
jgi:hypothetical protein